MVQWWNDHDSGARTWTVMNAAKATITTLSTTSFSFSGDLTMTGNLIFSPTTKGVKGTTTNDNTSAGNVGEYVSSFQSTFTNSGLTTVWGDLTSISLTAGDWDVSVNSAWSRNTAVWTQMIVSATITSGNSGTGATEGDTMGIFKHNGISSNIDEISLSVPVIRFSLSATTTIYLKYRADYSSAGPPQAAGRISARRVR